MNLLPLWLTWSNVGMMIRNLVILKRKQNECIPVLIAFLILASTVILSWCIYLYVATWVRCQGTTPIHNPCINCNYWCDGWWQDNLQGISTWPVQNRGDTLGKICHNHILGAPTLWWRNHFITLPWYGNITGVQKAQSSKSQACEIWRQWWYGWVCTESWQTYHQGNKVWFQVLQQTYQSRDGMWICKCITVVPKFITTPSW